MQIRKLTLRNWRSVKEVEIRFQDILVLIGKNNHGKSNILCSILFLLGQRLAREEDFFDGSNTLSVEAEFDLNASEQKHYAKYTSGNGRLLMRREASINGNDEYLFPERKKRTPASKCPIDCGDVFFVPALPQAEDARETLVTDRLLVHVAKKILRQSNVHQSAKLLRKLEKRLEYDLRDWGASIEIRIEQSEQSKQVINPYVWIDNSDAADVRRKQDGLQRSLLAAILKRYADFLSEHDLVEENLWLLLEEPELFLHPQAQRDLYESLKTLADRQIQIVFSTHSSFFIDLSRYESICITRKPNRKIGTTIQQYSKRLFSGEVDKKHFNMTYWINPDRGEMFFAKKVILVEGPTEKVILPKLAKRIGLDISEYTIIDCAGKTNMTMYVSLLNKFHIPYIVVYDKDLQSYRSHKGKRFSIEQSQVIERKVDRKIGDTVVFVNDIEEELGIGEHGSKNKPFIALQFITRDKFLIPVSLVKKIEQIFADEGI